MVTRWLGVAAVLLTGVALYFGASELRRQDNRLAVLAPVFAPPALVPNRVTSFPIRLPRRAVALAALTEAAQTTFIALDTEGHGEPLGGPIVVDERTVIMRAGVVAYLVLPGLDPTQNYIEVRELTRESGWQIKAEEGNAIFGFALEPQGTHLVYLEADARAVRARIPWWVVDVDLATGAKTVMLDGAQTGAVGLLPLDWSLEMILFRGLTPFTEQYHGLWATDPDGSNLRPIVAEADYIDLPRLSPEGDRLALLVSDPSALPAARRQAGEPPANIIQILEPRSNELTLTSPLLPQRDLASPEWTADGLIAIAGQWDANRNAFTHRSVIELQPDTGKPPRILYSTDEGEITRLTSCSDGGWLAAIQFRERTQIIRAGQAEPVAEFVGPALDWMACLSYEEAR
jgi:hypothetical protein